MAEEAISEAYAHSPFLENMAARRNGRQRVANARKLLTLAAKQPELGPREYAEQVREIQRIRHREGDASADDEKDDLVSIMTVHKAKGLEWPVVVVAETHKPLLLQP